MIHNRAYQDFLTLLTNFRDLILDSQNQMDLISIKHQFNQLEQWFQPNISNLNDAEINIANRSRWQSMQREIHREFKLLKTDMLFLASARQNTTKNKRLKSISDRLEKLSNYCQAILQEANNEP